MRLEEPTMHRVDPKALREQLSLSDPVDTESMGFLRFVGRLSEALNLDLPRQEHSKLATLAGCYDFLAARSSSGALPRLEPEAGVSRSGF
ncbi:MAG: hypothetical protein H6Q89_515 [Myxococcaceae bacterium]|nr:hypothetical protein [Myxococcaceae bacterium]